MSGWIPAFAGMTTLDCFICQAQQSSAMTPSPDLSGESLHGERQVIMLSKWAGVRSINVQRLKIEIQERHILFDPLFPALHETGHPGIGDIVDIQTAVDHGVEVYLPDL